MPSSLQILPPVLPSLEMDTPISIPITSGLPHSYLLSYPVLETPNVPTHAGVITHTLSPKMITTCTTALKSIPDTLVLAPSLLKILYRRAQIFLAFRRFPTTSCKSSPKSVIICPNYLKGVTNYSGLTWA